MAPIDYDPNAPAVVAIGKLARKLVRAEAVARTAHGPNDSQEFPGMPC